MVTMRDMRVVRSFGVVSLGMVFSGQCVMFGRVFMVLGCVVMMIRDRMSLRHTFLLVDEHCSASERRHTRYEFVTDE